MTDFERAVLTALEPHTRPVSWYPIAMFLSNVEVSSRPNLLEALASLVRRGLVQSDSETVGPRSKFLITALGRQAVSAPGSPAH